MSVVSIVIRALFWFFIYLLLLAAADINVKYQDGLYINFKGWAGLIWGEKS